MLKLLEHPFDTECVSPEASADATASPCSAVAAACASVQWGDHLKRPPSWAAGLKVS